MTSQRKKAVCVYCGHKTGTDPELLETAHELGKAISKRDLRLVYGGGDLGLMGAVSGGALSSGGSVLGIIPKHLHDREIETPRDIELIITDTMHERKKIMVFNSDLFVLLPGGLGSLDEFFELITWRQIELHNKPCIILNLNGFWDGLIHLIDHQIQAGFVPAENKEFMIICNSLMEAEAAFDRHFG